MAGLATLANISNLSWLNDNLRLIKDLQAETDMEVPQEQVGSFEVMVQSATELKGYPMTLIAYPQKGHYEDQESEDLDL